jgi:hypothetical protein
MGLIGGSGKLSTASQNAKSTYCHWSSVQATTIGAHVLLPLAIDNKSKQKVDSLPLLEGEPSTFCMQGHLADSSSKSHPTF